RLRPDVQPDDMRSGRPHLNWHEPPTIVLGDGIQAVGSRSHGSHPLDAAGVPGLEIGSRPGRLGGSSYQPRSIHSSRCGRSRPIVVGLPCPGRTSVSSGSVKSFSRMLSMIVGKLAYGLAVFPGPPGNRVSPENTRSAETKQTLPGVCPGVCHAMTS